MSNKQKYKLGTWAHFYYLSTKDRFLVTEHSLAFSSFTHADLNIFKRDI